MTQHFGAANFNASNLIERDVANAMSGAQEANRLFRDALDNQVPLNTEFPQTYLGSQLRSVAQTISLRDVMLVNRQVFFVAIGGFEGREFHHNQFGRGI